MNMARGKGTCRGRVSRSGGPGIGVIGPEGRKGGSTSFSEEKEAKRLLFVWHRAKHRKGTGEANEHLCRTFS
jgi:hypothetical protein